MEFQGFQNSFPFVLALIIGILCCILAWYSYKKYASISNSWKLLLSSLRGSALLLILILIFNPFFKTEQEIEIKPKLAVLLDASESTSISKGLYEGNRDYNRIISELRNFPQSTSVDFYGFGDTVNLIEAENFDNSSSLTNLFEAVEHINSTADDYDAAILVSDGIFTIGKNPIIEASNSLIPIHVIGIGDTSKVRDISVRNIVSNGTGYTNTLHQVDVELAQFGYGSNQVEIQLRSEDKLIDSQLITLVKDKEIENIEFEFELENAGLQQYQIQVTELNGEWVTENNLSSFSIDVLDSKTRILHIVSGVHPDVKTIRSILQNDENIELSTFTFFDQSNFNQDLKESSNYDLIIVHGALPATLPASLVLDIENTPTLYIPVPDESSLINNDSYTLVDNGDGELFEVQILPNQENKDHPILNINEVEFSDLPPLQSSIRASSMNPSAEILYNSEFQNISTDSPLLLINELGNIRRSQLNAIGFYRIYLSPKTSDRSFISSLISNIVDWTSTDPDNRLLKIKPVSNSISSGEPFLLNGSVLNENGDIESSALVEVEITGSDYRSDFTMSNIGDGNYRLQVPSLPEGSYYYTATARKGNRNIETQSGEFLITEANLELSNTIRNDDLLRNISTGSGGSFINYDEADNYWSTSGILDNLKSNLEIREEYIFPVQHLFWFILALLLLGSEWFIRKRFALP